ncbi:MAG: translation initiation factor IF-2, partial [Myxococcota bacterium]
VAPEPVESPPSSIQPEPAAAPAAEEPPVEAPPEEIRPAAEAKPAVDAPPVPPPGEMEEAKREGEREDAKPRKKGPKPAARRAREVIDVLPEEIPTLARSGPNWRGGISVNRGGVQTYTNRRSTYRKRTVVKKGGGSKTLITTPKASKRVVKISGTISVQELAKRMSIKATELLKKLVGLGAMVNINSSVDFDTASLAAQEFGYEAENVAVELDALLGSGKAGKPEDLRPRPPVVTVMGHVDHGKTSLLDAIRSAKVTAGEAGGITQHIGAYHVRTPKGNIVFLDTPGHEAFTSMRARGAQVTDIVVLVVAADDGVMPQTVEAIDHAKAAGVPILVAVNKIDKPGADPDRVKNKLMEHELVPESLGGDTIFVNVSAKEHTGLDDLLENILLQTEMMELKSDPDKPASGVVIEGKVERGRGPVATVLVREGTLKRGDIIVAGVYYGRVRAMKDDRGKDLKEVSPGLPAEVQGLSGVPMAGDAFDVAADEQVAREVAETRAERDRESHQVVAEKPTLETIFEKIQEGEAKDLHVVIKADSQGSVEAVREALEKLSGKDVKITMIHGAVGGINESDVNLASASGAVVIGFHVRPDPKARALAQREKVDLRLYTVIYEAVDEIRKAMEGLLEPTFRETTVGRAEVREVFSISGLGTIAGCMVSDGTIGASNRIRVIRDSVGVYTGKIGSLRRFKDDVKEVQSGVECGIRIENFNDVKVGDVLEAFTVEELAPRLESSGGKS